MGWECGIQLQEGKYVIEKTLAEGGFGITYLAKENTGKLVVIKTLNEKRKNTQNFVKYQQDFVNEALRMAKCTHPHIVRIDELIYEEPLWCMVMEYIEGTDLATLVENEGVLPESEALRYIQQIGEALIWVHQRGFLHRDIKPMNILVRASGLGSSVSQCRNDSAGTPTHRTEAVLIDFGLAREFTPNLTQIHTQYFSNGFAPIEQYEHRSLRGAYTDVYGLAATLYAILTGKAPELAPTRDRSVTKYQTDPLIPPQQLNPLISDRVNAAILQGLALEPENRPQSVLDWLKLFTPALETTIAFPINQMMAPTLIPENITPNWSSAVGMDYSKLRDLLAQGNWKDADVETAHVMLQVCDRHKEGKFTIEELKNFPCRDLRILDKLWIDSSNGHFGFSLQNHIWKSVNQSYEEFGNCIGWCRENTWLPYSNLTFDLTAPEGHLPTWGRRGRLWSYLAARLESCSL